MRALHLRKKYLYVPTLGLHHLAVHSSAHLNALKEGVSAPFFGTLPFET